MRTTIVVTVLVIGAALVGAFLYRDFLFPEPERGEAQAPPEAAPERAADAPKTLDSEAQKFVAELTEPQEEPVAADKADHFVTKDQVISLLPKTSIELTTPLEIERDPALAPDTPITLIREVEQIETTTPEKIIAEAGGDLDKRVRVLEGDEVRETTVREVLERYAANPDEPINVVKNVDYFEITTPAELAADDSIEPDEQIRIITEPYTLEAATIAELLKQQRLANPDSIFYVRTVRPSDEQGIWGIIHDGIVTNFAQGMAIRRGKEVNTYKVDIPRDADELLPDESSSFLGKLIYEKTEQSHVYNFKHNRMGRNPDRIVPGQEIVIINFDPEELIDIYKHFVREQG